ncbi:E3 SUMO-protein ligase RanBP2 [Toxocara canis]|uniref:E3 SUMO-protein ligase RanBP2 n=1 Tax=Toxocara canis TaxID=6265 RepID=A0A0B2V7K1_TOXCA|nr:E3 SUMO-protein ligase RanBP2 [Toxocara canis]
MYGTTHTDAPRKGKLNLFRLTMKLTGQREDGDATAHSPPMHISDEDTLIASTLLNMAQTQVQMLGKINEVQADQKTILEELRRERSQSQMFIGILQKADQKTILEELRRERSQSQMFIGILQKCHEGELERLMKVMTLFCERTRVYEQQQPTAATTQAVNSAAFSAANMGTPGGVQRAFIPSAAAYGSQATPSTFFGAAPITDDGAYAQYLYLQQQIAAQQQRMMVPQGGISGSSLGTVGYSSLSGADMLSFASPSKPGFGAAVPPPVAAYSSPQVIAAAQKVTAPPVQQQQQNAFGITANRMPATQQPFVGAVPNITSSGPPPTLTPAFVSESKEPPKGTAGTTTFSFSNAASATTTSASGHAQPPGTKTTTPLAVKLSGGFTFGISTSQSSAIAAAQKSPAIPKTEPAGKEGEEDEVPEFEPSAHFEPVIPLPDLVEVTTGEENEKVVFAERCKLYRFAKEGNEWKERGVGVLKILQDPSTGRYRIVMRREQIHKVCANHKIQAAMSLTPMQKSDRAYVWLAQDFSEGEVAEEKLAARFKTVDIAKKFFDTFKMARDAAAAAESPVKSGGQATTTVKEVSKEKKTDKEKSAAKTDGTPKGFGDAFKPAAGSWECKTCYVRNNGDVSVCPCCNTSKDGTSANASAQSASIFARFVFAISLLYF